MSVTAAALVPGLIEALVKLGRPLLRRLVKWGIVVLLRVIRATQKRLRKRYRRVSKRLARATSERSRGRLSHRISWLTLRRANWAAARAWLAVHQEKLTDAVVEAVAERVHEAIPEKPLEEAFARWRAASAAA